MKKVRVFSALLLITCAFSTGKLSAQSYKRTKAFNRKAIRTDINDALFDYKTTPVLRAQEEKKQRKLKATQAAKAKKRKKKSRQQHNKNRQG